jgi:hypothetical protein
MVFLVSQVVRSLSLCLQRYWYFKYILCDGQWL